MVDGVDLHVDRNEVVGLIGANGAGKTTIMNAIGGFVPADGRVELLGHDISSLAAARRAERGLGRSFQDARLFGDLTVLETVALAHERVLPTRMLAVLAGIPTWRRRDREQLARARELVDYLGLGGFADHFVGTLSTGTRRICELACILALEPRVICLDEPTAGVAQRETEAFAPLITRIQAELGASLLVIEHDMPFVMSISDRVYCLETGTIIAEGPPDQVRHDPRVDRLVPRHRRAGDPAAPGRRGQSRRRTRPPPTTTGALMSPPVARPRGGRMTATIRSVRAGDVTLEIAEAGAGGRPLLLVHGFTGAKEDFADYWDRLAERGWHVVAPDLRGHGASDHPPRAEDYSLDLFEADVLALVDEPRLGPLRAARPLDGRHDQPGDRHPTTPTGSTASCSWTPSPAPSVGGGADAARCSRRPARVFGMKAMARFVRKPPPRSPESVRRLYAERPGYGEWTRGQGPRHLAGDGAGDDGRAGPPRPTGCPSSGRSTSRCW